ncbi:hypothetical protein [Spirosoma daeguense]
MIRLRHFLIVGLGVSNAIDHKKAESADWLNHDQKSYVKIDFAGTSRIYTDIGTCTFSRVGATDCWYVRAGAGNQNYLSIAVCGASNERAFAFGTNQSVQPAISLLTYSLGKSIYSSYHNDDHLLTEGTVLLDHYKTKTGVKGSFKGFLMPRNNTPFSANGASIAGQFCLIC